MTSGDAPKRLTPDWRQSFVEELGLLALDSGTPRAMVRILGWLVICEPPEQSARDIQTGLQLSAGTVSSATRALTSLGYLERVAYPGDRHIYFRARPGGWDRALRARLQTLTQLREVAERALAAAGDAGHPRLKDMRDVCAWFEERIEDLLAKRAAES
ncbi:MAG TPA: winged helix DNA-binding protein [Streptosporangiaceae bacterium]